MVKASYHSFCSKHFCQKILNSIFIPQSYSNDSYHLHIENCGNNYFKTQNIAGKATVKSQNDTQHFLRNRNERETAQLFKNTHDRRARLIIYPHISYFDKKRLRDTP